MALMLCIQLCCTWMLVGLIWTIQMVVYPQFLRVGGAGFAEYHLGHCWRIGFLISPLVLVEFVTALWLLVHGHRETAFLISVGLIPLNWLSTTFVQAPLHLKLMGGFETETVRRLIRSNWVRTLAWTARGILVGYLATRWI